jgi:cyanophycin synthetase
LILQKLKKGIILGRRGFEQGRTVLFSKDWRLKNKFEVPREIFFNNYWENVAKTVGAEIDSVGYGYYRLKRDGKTTFVRRGEVMLDDHITLNIAGNKPLVHQLLKEQGYTVPEYLEYDLSSLSSAESFMQERNGNFVVKPASGAAGGWGITTKINSASRLRHASNKASAFSGKLIIEQELPGENYRLLYLNGDFIDAIKRDSPGVTGNGTNTLKELINKENENRLNASVPYALSPLTMDLDCLYTLADRGESLNDVPPAGKTVTVKTTTNQYSRYENHSVVDKIHPSIVDYGREISKVINVTLSGVDVMMTDCSLPLEESGCVVNEINTTPGLHHHALVSDSEKEVAVGPRIIEYIFDSMT